MGSPKLQIEAERIPPGLHPAFLQTTHRAPNITNSDVIMAFLSGITCKELVRELGRSTPITANGLMDIITNFATDEEAIGAIFGSD
jgi:hypothetical protein